MPKALPEAEEVTRRRKIRYVQVSPQAYASALKEQGVPADFVWLLDYLFTNVLDGRNAHVTGGVQRALGRSPRDFSVTQGMRGTQ